MRIKTIGFIGLGLIGGSIAKAIKQYHPDIRILAYMRSRDTLEQAVREGTVDQACQAAGAEFSACDLIYLCAPVATNARYLETLKDLLAPSCLLTDVGSTKTDIHEKVQALGLTGRFIGGHPMAGSEKTGYENAKPHLIENAYYMLTPGEEVPQETVRAFTAFTASLKAIPMVVDYRQHDFITACVSHLPHLIASSLVELVRDLDSPEELMKQIAAGGFKDITRIASSSPVMWENICLSNREQILKLMDSYSELFGALRRDIASDNENALLENFSAAKDYRDSLAIPAKGAHKRIYELYLDLIDEAGGIAELFPVEEELSSGVDDSLRLCDGRFGVARRRVGHRLDADGVLPSHRRGSDLHLVCGPPFVIKQVDHDVPA